MILSQLVRPFFPYVLTALQVVLLLMPMVCTLLSFGRERVGHACMAIAVWALVMAWVQQRSDDRTPTLVAGEMCVVALVGIKTLLLLNDVEDSESETLWMVPLLAAIAFTLLIHLDMEFIHVQVESKVTVTTTDTITYNPRIGVLLSAVIVGTGMAQALMDNDLSTRSLLLLFETGIAAVLVWAVLRDQENQTRRVWKGGSVLVLSWIFLQLCTLFISKERWLVLLSIGMVIMLSIAMVEDKDTEKRARLPPWVRVTNALWSGVETLVDLVRLVVSSSLTYEVVVLACVFVILLVLREPWYTAHADFPDLIRTPATLARDLVDGVVRKIYSFLGLRNVQDIFTVAAPSVGNIRGLINRYVRPNYKWLKLGSEGVTYTSIPFRSLPVLVSVALGPVLATLTIVTRISSWGIWALAACGSALFLFQVHLAGGAQVNVISLLDFGEDEATYDREYTQSGQYGLLAQLALYAACVCLFVIHVNKEPEVVGLLRRGVRPTVGARPAIKRRAPANPSEVQRLIAPGRSSDAVAEPSPLALNVAKGIQDVVNFLTAPSFLVAMAAILGLLILAFTIGSPLRTPTLARQSDGAPGWLVVTDRDRAALIASPFVKMLIDAVGPQARIAVLAPIVLRVVTEQLSCVPCYCVPDGGVTSFFKKSFGLRRMLLEAQGTYANANRTTRNTRRLLQAYDFDPSERCTKPSSSCSTFNICVYDLIKPVTDYLTFMATLQLKALEYAVDVVVEEMIGRIPGTDAIIGIFERLEELLQIEGFHPFNSAKFTFRLTMLGNLRSFRFPALTSFALDTLTIVLLSMGVFLALVLASQFNLLMPLLSSGYHSLQLTLFSALLSLGITVVQQAFEIQNVIEKKFGWQVGFPFTSDAWMYGVCLGLLALSLFLWIKEAATRDEQAILRAARKVVP